MSHWSESHRAFVVEQYLKTGESLVRARRNFCKHFNIRRLSDSPSTQLIRSWVQRFRQEGTVVNRTPPGPSTSAATPERVAEVRREILRDPHKSIRKIAASTGIKKSTVHSILRKKLKLHPHEIQIAQRHNENDCVYNKMTEKVDISHVFQNLAWCQTDWVFPSLSKETNELIHQCHNLPRAEVSDDIDEIVRKSNDFPISFPVESVRIQNLRTRRPLENLKRNIVSTYPLIHERVLLLMAYFLIYKREYGTNIEKAFYKDMTVPDLIDRMLTKRAVSFLGARDKYQLFSGDTGAEGWEKVGTLQQKPPLILENCLSYDEMKLSAMIFVSGYTEFINDGARKNSGVIREDNIEKDGVIIGLVGARLKKKFRMEYEDLLITDEQNSVQNGYGEETSSTSCLDNLKPAFIGNNESSRHMWRQLWAKFYQVHSYTYEELTSSVNIKETSDKKLKYTDRYVKKPHSSEIFDNEVFYKRLIIPFDCTLLETNERAKAEGKKAFLNVVGIGLGVWKAMPHQNDVFILAFLERIRYFLKEELVNYISDVNFAYIKPHNSIEALFTQNVTNQEASQEKKMFLKSEKHPNGGIYLTLENREPSTKFPAEHAGKLLVTTYAWDGNAQPGNEFWFGKLSSSGDPAAACSTQVAELHNAHVNNAVSAKNLRVAGRYGVLPLQEYSQKL